MRTMRRATRRPRAGMTLIEVLLAGSVMAVILGAIATTALSGQKSAATNLAVNGLETEARRVVDRIAEELIQADSLGLAPVPAPPFGSSTLAYHRDTGFSGGAITWGPTTRLRFQYASGETNNGADDDSDGLADEGVLVFTTDVGLPTQRDIVWAHDVREFLQGETGNGLDDNGNGLIDEQGLAFSLTGKTLTIRLTLERKDPKGKLLTKTVQTSVRIRN